MNDTKVISEPPGALSYICTKRPEVRRVHNRVPDTLRLSQWGMSVTYRLAQTCGSWGGGSLIGLAVILATFRFKSPNNLPPRSRRPVVFCTRFHTRLRISLNHGNPFLCHDS